MPSGPFTPLPRSAPLFDRLLVFCSTVGVSSGRPFYFTRQNPASPTADWSSRNAGLYSYLQSLTDKAFPGFGGISLKGKYAADPDQILTEIFDYVRCTNLADNSEGTANSYTSTATPDPITKRGQVVPIEPGNGTRGFGRIATISELGLVLIKVDDRDAGQAGPANSIFYKATAPLPSGTCTPATETLLEWSLLPKLNCPMAGYSGLANDLRVKFTNVNLTIGGRPAGGTDFPDLYDTGRLGGNTHDSKIGGNIGLVSLFEVKDTREPLNPGAPADSMFPTGLVKVTGTTGTAIIVSGSVDVEIWAPATNGTKIQTITFNFPAAPTSPPLQVPIPGVSDYAPGANHWMGTFRANTRQAFSNKTVNFTYNSSPSAKGYPRLTQIPPGTSALYRANFLSWFDSGNIEHPTLDTIRSLSPTGMTAPGVALNGDIRLVAATKNVPANIFELTKQPDGRAPVSTDQQVDSLRMGARKLFGSAGWLFARGTGVDYNSPPDVPSGVTVTGGAGDWDNGPGLLLDGALLNKADEGSGIRRPGDVSYLQDLYYAEDSTASSATFFSPNRQIPSAVMFGSLPTGVKRGKPWQTLLFRPPGLLGNTHPGGVSPPDHVLLDLFWMPVVEPYAISEPFATAGKINLNYQIAPFTYIKRDTGMRAVMKSVMITALNPDQNNYIQTYKNGGSGVGAGVVTRRGIDLSPTLRQIDELRFKAGVNKPFISASEICDIPLVPADALNQVSAGITASDSASAMQSKLVAFWAKHRLTGDNSLERPYALIYPRVTTRSNSYTVHVRVQTLKKAPADREQAIFKDGGDQVLGEFRGSFVIERYLDPNSAGFYVNGELSKPSDETNPEAVLGPYRFRVVSSKQFGLLTSPFQRSRGAISIAESRASIGRVFPASGDGGSLEGFAPSIPGAGRPSRKRRRASLQGRRRAGFSLLELIVMISIILVLVALLAPAFSTLVRSSSLTTAAATILDELNLARQTALARNRVVEVRFYSLPGEVGQVRAFRALRSLLADESGDYLAPLGALKRFPTSVVALGDAKFSTLLNDTARPPQADDVENFPDGPGTPFKSIRFRPTGGVELSAYTNTNDNWFLTIKNETNPTYPDRPADNFATIQLDPATGRARQFRP